MLQSLKSLAGTSRTNIAKGMLVASGSKDTDFRIKPHKYQTVNLPLPVVIKSMLAEILASHKHCRSNYIPPKTHFHMVLPSI